MPVDRNADAERRARLAELLKETRRLRESSAKAREQAQELCVRSLELEDWAQRAIVNAFVIARQSRRNMRLIQRAFRAVGSRATPIDLPTFRKAG